MKQVNALPGAVPHLLPLLLSLLTFGPMASARAADRLDEVVVTGSRLRNSLDDTTDSMTVITRAQIERMNAATGDQLFRQVPGLQVDQLGPGGLSSAYIRGSDSNHVLVLIDGLRVNDTTSSRGGGFDLSSIDPATIERIEILRGAASAVYGAEAMGGVINIITRTGLQADGSALSAGAGIGGRGYRSFNGRAGGTGNDGRGGTWRYALGASSLRDGEDRYGGHLDVRQYSAAARWTPAAAFSVDLDARRGEREGRSFPDDSGGLRLAEIRTLDRKRGHDTSLGLRARWQLNPLWTLHASAGSYRHLEDIDSPGVAPGVRSDFGVPASVSGTDFRRRHLQLHAVAQLPALGDGSELAVGIEHQRERGENHTVYDFFGEPTPVDFDLTRSTRSGFAELKWRATPLLTLRAGLRRDDVGGTGARTSPSLGMNLHLPSLDGQLKASYGTGFKPPSFFALGLPEALGGNPGLRPERSRGGSIGYEQRWWDGAMTAGAVLFKSRYTDLVTFDNETNQTVNANRVDIHGTELEAAWQIDKAWLARAHFTRLYSRIADSDEPLRQRPGRRGGLELGWAPAAGGPSVHWRVEYAAKTFDSSIPTGNLMLPTSWRHDLALRWRLSRQIELWGGVDNVFDKANEAYVGAPSLGRRARVGLVATL